jgi:signal transduction histidine kinase
MAGNALNRIKATSDLEAMVRTRDHELESIYKVTSSASSTLDLHQALHSALLLSLEAVRTDSGAIFLYDDIEKHFQLITSIENSQKIPPLFSGKQLMKHLEKVIAQKKTVVVSDLGAVNKNLGDEKICDQCSLIGLPMRAQDRVTGVMVVIRENSSQINLDEMTLLSFIADHLALVVDNTRLFKKAERSAILEERSRLARELHDSVTQSLYSANMYAAGAQKFYQIGKYAEIASYLTQIGGLVQQALKDMRLLVYELRSPELARNGLIGAIQNRLDAVERRLGIKVSVLSEWSTVLSEPTEQEIYRIITEALNNSIKYAHASMVSISFLSTEESLRLLIEDDGVGFVLEQGLQSGGVGLTTMRERAERIGGVLTIQSNPERGTTIVVALPNT